MRVLQQREVRAAVRIGDDELAVDPRAVEFEFRQRLDDRPDLVRPVDAIARDAAHVVAVDSGRAGARRRI